MITTTDFQSSIVVTSSPAEAFDHVCRVADWWTTDVEGQTRGQGSNFTVRFADTSVDFRITDFVPGSSVTWLVTDCFLPHFPQETEWTGTTVRFDISPADSGSQVTITHFGLGGLECSEMCSAGWQHHVGESLRDLIQNGKGAPKGRLMHAEISVPATAAQAFEAICRVADWWVEDFTGSSRSVGDRFQVRFDDRHWTECRIADMTLGQRIVWEVTDSHLEWLDNKTEWTGTEIIWVVQERDGSAKVTLTHKGLEPEAECFAACQKGWAYFVSESLARLITEGKGRPGFPASTGETNE